MRLPACRTRTVFGDVAAGVTTGVALDCARETAAEWTQAGATAIAAKTCANVRLLINPVPSQPAISAMPRDRCLTRQRNSHQGTTYSRYIRRMVVSHDPLIGSELSPSHPSSPPFPSYSSAAQGPGGAAHLATMAASPAHRDSTRRHIKRSRWGQGWPLEGNKASWEPSARGAARIKTAER